MHCKHRPSRSSCMFRGTSVQKSHRRTKNLQKYHYRLKKHMYTFLWVKQKCRPGPNAAPKWKRHLTLHLKNILKQPEIAAVRARPDWETSKPVHAGLISFSSTDHLLFLFSVSIKHSSTIIHLHPDKSQSQSLNLKLNSVHDMRP